MGKPDIGLVEEIFGKVLNILNGAADMIAAGIKTLISFVLAGLDLGVIGDLCAWAVNTVIKAVCNMKAKALSIALRCEYLLRAGNVSFKTMQKAFKLTNKCSVCKCIGHNKTNHPHDIDDFLMGEKLASYTDAATNLVEGVNAAEQDGFWDWLFGE